MTAPQLLAYIAAALLLQLLAAAAFAVWRRPLSAGAPPAAGVEDAVSAGTGAWTGWRDFRVVHRAFEDAAQTQCSFQLQPVDGAPLTAYLPGQYLRFSLKLPEGLAGAPAGARSITRRHSLSDRPDPTGYRITVKRVLEDLAQAGTRCPA